MPLCGDSRRYHALPVHSYTLAGRTLSIQRFCRREHLATATFFQWKRRFRQASPGPEASEAAAVNFAAVRIVPEASAATPTGTIEIVLGRDRRIRLAGPLDKATLADVLAVLEGSSPC
jgi:hypothetical protein